MNEKWQALLVVLNKILSVYQAILTLSQQKKEVLVAAKTQELEKITKQEEILVLQISKLEELRGRLIKEIMVTHGVTAERVSLEQLRQIATPDVIEQLDVFKKEIGLIMAAIVPLNKLNSELIKQALGFINYNINILSQTEVGPTYAAKGQANEQTKRRVFDARA